MKIHNALAFYRSSRSDVFCKKSVLRNFVRFTGKHLCQSRFFNKVAGLRPGTLLKKETLVQVLSWEFCEISKNTFFHRTPPAAASETLLIHESLTRNNRSTCSKVLCGMTALRNQRNLGKKPKSKSFPYKHATCIQCFHVILTWNTLGVFVGFTMYLDWIWLWVFS